MSNFHRLKKNLLTPVYRLYQFSILNPFFKYFIEKEALAFKEAVFEQVKSKKLVVVCDGIDEKILPNLKSPVPKVNRGPIGPHPCGSYEVR